MNSMKNTVIWLATQHANPEGWLINRAMELWQYELKEKPYGYLVTRGGVIIDPPNAQTFVSGGMERICGNAQIV